MTDDIRALIREVLAEELKAHRAASSPRPSEADVLEEAVHVEADGDLTSFVKHVLDLASDAVALAEIKAGRRRFRLAPRDGRTALAPNGTVTSSAEPSAFFEKGLVTEKQVAVLPKGSLVRVNKKVKFTPLALDEIRRRRIRMEREKQ